MTRPKSAVLNRTDKQKLQDLKAILRAQLKEQNAAVKDTEKSLAAVLKKLKG